ncbi:lytic murein transglycosylase [Propioniciclava sp.]|uniref:lytic transglycosylase domain-containing protein n=1 Tax=Propioniciclava sp. TaxID=2038686 RepID=UPI002617D5C2|nr:lytic murein transglycosylase [Propioniciclava sp.]
MVTPGGSHVLPPPDPQPASTGQRWLVVVFLVLLLGLVASFIVVQSPLGPTSSATPFLAPENPGPIPAASTRPTAAGPRASVRPTAQPSAPTGTPEPTTSVSVEASAGPAPGASGGATATPGASGEPSASTGTLQGPVVLVDEGWLVQTAQKTGIPARALDAYGAAQLALEIERPQCAIAWNTLAAIGYVESRHGSYGGATLGDDGVVRPAIVGVALDGNGVARIPDSDGGRFDGDPVWDRAVGPMQFIPGTWARWGSDANGDGVADPQNIDDAALSTARYLCSASNLDTAESWRAAIIAYNRSDVYVNDIAANANRFARASLG